MNTLNLHSKQIYLLTTIKAIIYNNNNNNKFRQH